ncbi:COMD4-like protein [Mya arenaria]|uniref:COMD4-like protein n=2 Tax=Mya arenaria TaxID=6604 RepID=A0ABY7E5E1_MYAAR|nr:COMD4-like protein [Mya arenaria]
MTKAVKRCVEFTLCMSSGASRLATQKEYALRFRCLRHEELSRSVSPAHVTYPGTGLPPKTYQPTWVRRGSMGIWLTNKTAFHRTGRPTSNMRFRFCGDLDCPDWVLAEISILSKMTSIKMKLLCVQVIKMMLGQEIDYDKVYKLTADAKFEEGDVKASISALHFILASAAKYAVDADSLANELQQLGLPKEHTASLGKSYGDSLCQLQEQFGKESLKLSQLEGVEWRVDYILSSSLLQEINEPCVQMKMNVKSVATGTAEPVAFTATSDKFRVFLNELKQAGAMMDNLAST